jgi:succinyl-CoA synthetase beta subunit
MYLHEHDAKQLLARYGVPVPEGCVAGINEPVPADLPQPGPWVVKGQIAAGGRGKAGLVLKAATRADVDAHTKSILGKTVKGRRVERVRIERCIEFVSELYIGLLLDAEAGGVRVIVSARGGMDIEAVPAVEIRSEIVKLDTIAIADCVARLAMAFEPKIAQALREAGAQLANAFVAAELRLIEINPLFVRADGSWVAGDAKVVADENALERQPALLSMVKANAAQYTEAAVKLEHGFDYVVVDPAGEIGLLTTGAGLSMMLIDELRALDLKPYNFLDVRTGGFRGDPSRLISVLKWINAGSRVRVVLVNIFAGITDLGEFSRLLVEAIKRVPEFNKPVVARLVGNNLAAAREVFAAAGIALYTDLDQAVAEVRRRLEAA